VNQAEDQQLLTEFATRKNEEAFAFLVSRYVDLVYSVALRLVVDSHLAEDVTQQVFAALATQADALRRTIGPKAALSGWLHVTTRNLAAKTVRTEMRRRAREQEAFVMSNLQGDSTAEWMEMAPQLDAALGELRADDRDLLLQRFFERKTARQIAERQGLSEEAAQKRLTRAADRLRQTLLARGVSVSAAGFASVLTANCVQAAPVAFAGTLAQGALALSASAAPLGFLAWTTQAFSPLVMTKTQFAGLVAVVAMVGAPVGIQQHTLAELKKQSSLLTVAPIERPASDPSQLTSAPKNGKVSDADEVNRLRSQAAALRAQLQTKRSQPSSARVAALERVAGEVKLGPGRERVPIADLTYAGVQTPEAALQSIFYYSREGDVEGVASLSLVAPDKIEEWNEILAMPDKREELAEHLIQTTRGATSFSAVEVNETGSVLNEREGLVDPGPKSSVGIIEKITLDERRVRLTFETGLGKDLKTQSINFGLTSSGWKQIP
jgi:RNA polymerase sigma factor (sigma-70 family)